MIHLITCHGYHAIASVLPTTAYQDVPALCREAEQHSDGWAVVARQDGCLIADAEGLYDRRAQWAPDAATRTGMYDHW